MANTVFSFDYPLLTQSIELHERLITLMMLDGILRPHYFLLAASVFLFSGEKSVYGFLQG